MKNLKILLVGFLMGVGIGNIVEMILSLYYGTYIMATPQFLAQHNSLVFVKTIQTLLYGGFGIVGSLGAYFYNNEKSSRLFATCFHLSSLLIYFIAVGIYLKWFELNVIIFPILLFIIIYFIIWSIIYFTEKRKIEELNKKINTIK